MDTKEHLDGRYCEADRLSRELAAHEARWTAVEAQFMQVDREECIPLAAELQAARVAGSPMAIAIEADLKRARLKRDGIKQAFQKTREEYHRGLESLTREPIQKFVDYCLDYARSLPKKYQFRVIEDSHDLQGKRVRGTILVGHNSAKLAAARDRVFEAMGIVRKMQHSTLLEVEVHIKEYTKEFESFELDALEVEEVSDQTEPDMRPKEEACKPNLLGHCIAAGL